MMKLVSSILAIALAGSARAATVSNELDFDAGGCNVGDYKNTSCQKWCEGEIADKWAGDHECDKEQTGDWDWTSCNTSTIPIWSAVTTATVEGTAPSCKCGYGKCCGTRDYETNARCFKDDGKFTCSIGSNLACCCKSDLVEDALEDELYIQDGPFLRVKID